MRTIIVLVVGLFISACSSSQNGTGTEPSDNKVAQEPSDGDALAYYAGGCFWGVEHFLEKLPGVVSVDSGYMGGKSDSPTYKQVSSGSSGHLEAVRVRYNASKITYKAITKRFFEIHDPTQADGQGPDIGEQYLSAVFYASPDEQAQAQGLIDLLVERDYKVATKLKEVAAFWPAEDYHQDYYEKSGKEPYCHSPVSRFGK